MRSVVLAVALGCAGALAAVACRVPNEEHCANQDVPGNQVCRERNPGAPFCSPCERRLRGCVRFEPFACPGYDPDPGDDSGEAPMTDTGAGESATSSRGVFATESGSPAGASDAGTG